MPLLLTYKCSHFDPREVGNKIIPGECDFEIKKYSGPYMYVKIDDKEKVLPHSLEENRAKLLTGKSLNELAGERRIIFKNTKICLKCLKQEGECKCEKPELVEIPKLEGMICPKCKKGKIIKAQGGIS